MAYTFKSISDLPSDLYDHLYDLNKEFAKEQSKYFNHPVEPKKPEDYEFIMVNEGNNLISFYGNIPRWFGDLAKLHNIEYYRKALCYIANGKILKNRFGNEDFIPEKDIMTYIMH